MMAAMAQRESKLVRPRMLLALSLGLLALAGCRNRNASGPAYPSLDELARCEEGECVETSLTFRHWADAGYYRGRIPYHCTPGSELDGPQNPAVTRMILGIHGVISDVNGYVDVNAAPGLNHVRYVDQALLRAQRSDPSLKRESIAIIAPTFQRTQLWQPYTDEDKRYWTWASADYKFGADSAENRGFAGAVRAEPVSAFDVLDEFLRAALITFPNLEQIVIVGHSAGGQTVHRYALLGVGVHERLVREGIAIRYMPADGAHYTFPMMTRKLEPGRASVRPATGDANTGSWHWDAPRGCKGYDDWAYGLSGLADLPYDRAQRAADYAIDQYLQDVDRKLARQARNDDYGRTWDKAARIALRLQYASREIWHFQADTDTDSSFPEHCAIQVQGRSRFERFMHFEEAWTTQVGIPAPDLHFVRLANPRHHHSSVVVYTSEEGLHVLFH